MQPFLVSKRLNDVLEFARFLQQKTPTPIFSTRCHVLSTMICTTLYDFTPSHCSLDCACPASEV